MQHKHHTNVISQCVSGLLTNLYDNLDDHSTHTHTPTSVLQERTGLISGLERVESMKLQRNSSSVEADLSGCDVWFHLIEPGTLRMVSTDDARLRASLFDSRAQSSLLDVLEQALGEFV